ncbi:hypothetical protein OH492_15795 [Vibrio chagasii]|nr:hypothetical protein [Vibrio chagasii]
MPKKAAALKHDLAYSNPERTFLYYVTVQGKIVSTNSAFNQNYGSPFATSPIFFPAKKPQLIGYFQHERGKRS